MSRTRPLLHTLERCPQGEELYAEFLSDPGRRIVFQERPRRRPDPQPGKWEARQLPRQRQHKADLMFSLVYVTCKLFFKLCFWMILVFGWLMLAMIVLPVALIASVTGHERTATARQWQRSLRWRWRF
jgi:hypothetical protein